MIFLDGVNQPIPAPCSRWCHSHWLKSNGAFGSCRKDCINTSRTSPRSRKYASGFSFPSRGRVITETWWNQFDATSVVDGKSVESESYKIQQRRRITIRYVTIKRLERAWRRNYELPRRTWTQSTMTFLLRQRFFFCNTVLYSAILFRWIINLHSLMRRTVIVYTESKSSNPSEPRWRTLALSRREKNSLGSGSLSRPDRNRTLQPLISPKGRQLLGVIKLERWKWIFSDKFNKLLIELFRVWWAVTRGSTRCSTSRRRPCVRLHLRVFCVCWFSIFFVLFIVVV